MDITLQTPLLEFPGVGEVKAKKLEKLGLSKCVDLLKYYPRDYEDRSKLYNLTDAPLGEKVCICATVADRPVYTMLRKGLDLVKVTVINENSRLYLTFFNQYYVAQSLHPGQDYIFYGVVDLSNGRFTMTNPIFEPVHKTSFTGCIIPKYALTAGITNHFLCSLVRHAMPCAKDLPETLPRQVRLDHQLAQMEFACRNIHFPESFEAMELARRRLSFEELFFLSAGLTMLKGRRTETSGYPLSPQPIEEFLSLLPFSPTDAQLRVMEEILQDVTSKKSMNRLVQGDVGSGKTVIAAFAAWLACKSGFQAALMVPTEVLAEQHYHSLSSLLSSTGIRLGLLTGSLTPANKKKLQTALANGEIDFVIGTHALISPKVSFQRLALIVADEQHRFGVAQRATLAGKASNTETLSPHVLVMSATPIPRTLALIVYGDLDISVIDQLPPGRTPISTYVVGEDKRVRMYGFIRKQVQEGRQVYIICPSVEEQEPSSAPFAQSASVERKAVTTFSTTLQTEWFPDLRISYLHGKMKPKEKEQIMHSFAMGEIDVLVSTTVVEVGVDVPNASLIIIENAECFGLSQLHQLRGRVGRGQYASYCILMTSTRNSDTMTRLKILAGSTDGFHISEEDLKLRGPGDFFGQRQHGLPQMALADLTGDMRLLHQAQDAARSLLSTDPSLSQPDNLPVLQGVRRLFADTPDIFN